MANASLQFTGGSMGPDINFVPTRNLYPTAEGGTLGGAGQSLNTSTTTTDAGTGNIGVVSSTDVNSPVSQHGVWYWLGLVVFIGIMVWAARKAGGEEDFRNIRPTFYNFLTITLTAVAGIVGLKVIFTRFKIPGLSDVIMAS